MQLRSVIKESKRFNQVKIGDTGEDYGGFKGKVLAKGKGRGGWNKLRKFDDSNALAELIASGDLEYNSLELVVVDTEHGQILYVYGDGGFEV